MSLISKNYLWQPCHRRFWPNWSNVLDQQQPKYVFHHLISCQSYGDRWLRCFLRRLQIHIHWKKWQKFRQITQIWKLFFILILMNFLQSWRVDYPKLKPRASKTVSGTFWTSVLSKIEWQKNSQFFTLCVNLREINFCNI